MTQDAGSQGAATGGGGGTVPPGTNTEQVAPNPAGIPQPDPPEGAAAADRTAPTRPTSHPASAATRGHRGE